MSKITLQQDKKGKNNPNWKGAKVIIKDNNCFVFLTKGKRCIIDLKDLDIIKDFSWMTMYNHKDLKRGINIYAITRQNKKTILMHRLIMGAKKGQFIDHINRNSLDNRRCNLRFCTPSQNSVNTIKKRNKRIYRGVVKTNKKYRAMIRINKKQTYLGVFEDDVSAAKRYDKEARKVYKEFAITNF